jgi:hypothetical protein
MAERPAFAEVVAAVEQVKRRKWAEFRDEYGETGRDMALYLGRRLCGMKLAELAGAVELRNYGVVATNARRYERRLTQDRAEKARMKQVPATPPVRRRKSRFGFPLEPAARRRKPHRHTVRFKPFKPVVGHIHFAVFAILCGCLNCSEPNPKSAEFLSG